MAKERRHLYPNERLRLIHMGSANISGNYRIPILLHSFSLMFRFGKVLSLRADDHKAHVQWFQHGYQTVMGEVAHPQELFLTSSCTDIDLKDVVDVPSVKKLTPGTRPDNLVPNEFFYS